MHQVVTNTDILEANEQMADHNREHFKERGLYVVNLMSAPGAGKTSVLEETIRRLRNDYSL
ncbi:MAG TPA: hydrogenase accessory protein HypB, partial [Blastocatellia bacterium]|nr:hydrogenase accessory protein HypB [Blastocatellia bacterium]